MRRRNLSSINKANIHVYAHNKVQLGFALSALMLMSFPAKAEVKAISRANCLGFVNESITYDRPDLRNFHGGAISEHKPWGEVYSHVATDPDNFGTQQKWRYYAGDIDDASSVAVTGAHSWVVMDDDTGTVTESGSDVTIATDCNLSEW
jgi:hypothetical protein